MKRIALLFVATNAMAGERAAMLPDGTEIRLMDRECATDKNKLAGYIRHRGTPEVTGCWVFEDDLVRFSPANADFVIKKKWEETYPVIDGSEKKLDRSPRKKQIEIEV